MRTHSLSSLAPCPNSHRTPGRVATRSLAVRCAPDALLCAPCFLQVLQDGQLLALASEEGWVSILDTSCSVLPAHLCSSGTLHRPKAHWLAHENAIFDVAWAKRDSRLYSGSGDQMIGVWDTGTAGLLATLKGHNGSVKSLAVMPECEDVLASASRDGTVMLWDCRRPGRWNARLGRPFLAPDWVAKDAHAPIQAQPAKRGRKPLAEAARYAVTSVLFVPHSPVLVSSGCTDGLIKYWDLRNLVAPTATIAPPTVTATATIAAPPSSYGGRELCAVPCSRSRGRAHGITHLALAPQGDQLLASCSDNQHYLYRLLSPEQGPVAAFSGHTVAGSKSIRATFSPDGAYILSGSKDGGAYVWQVARPDKRPVVLQGHDAEVTAVAWGQRYDQVATCSDDCTVRVWRWRRIGDQPLRGMDSSEEGGALAGNASRRPPSPWVVAAEAAEALAVTGAVDGAITSVAAPSPAPLQAHAWVQGGSSSSDLMAPSLEASREAEAAAWQQRQQLYQQALPPQQDSFHISDGSQPGAIPSNAAGSQPGCSMVPATQSTAAEDQEDRMDKENVEPQGSSQMGPALLLDGSSGGAAGPASKRRRLATEGTMGVAQFIQEAGSGSAVEPLTSFAGLGQLVQQLQAHTAVAAIAATDEAGRGLQQSKLSAAFGRAAGQQATGSPPCLGAPLPALAPGCCDPHAAAASDAVTPLAKTKKAAVLCLRPQPVALHSLLGAALEASEGGNEEECVDSPGGHAGDSRPQSSFAAAALVSSQLEHAATPLPAAALPARGTGTSPSGSTPAAAARQRTLLDTCWFGVLDQASRPGGCA